MYLYKHLKIQAGLPVRKGEELGIATYQTNNDDENEDEIVPTTCK